MRFDVATQFRHLHCTMEFHMACCQLSCKSKICSFDIQIRMLHIVSSDLLFHSKKSNPNDDVSCSYGHKELDRKLGSNKRCSMRTKHDGDSIFCCKRTTTSLVTGVQRLRVHGGLRPLCNRVHEAPPTNMTSKNHGGCISLEVHWRHAVSTQTSFQAAPLGGKIGTLAVAPGNPTR